MAQGASIAKSTALITVATLGSRVTGLLRTWAMAFALGNTLITSAYQVANNLPNVVYELVAGGLLGAAFLPVYLMQKEKFGAEGGHQFAANLLNIIVIILGVLALLATVFAPQVVATQTFTVENSAEVSQYAVLFFRIFAIQIVFYGISGTINCILNANRVFFMPSFAPAINNIVTTISFFAYVPLSHIDAFMACVVLAVGTSLGVFVQMAVQIPALLKLGFKFVPRVNLRDPALKDALRIALPTVVYVVGTMFSFTFRNAFSLQASENGPSTLNYAWIWYQLPHGVVAVSIARAFFTEMGEDVARGDWDTMRKHVRDGISATLLLIIPLAALVCVLSTPLIQLFRAGAFSADDVGMVAQVLSAWVLALPFYSVLLYLFNVFATIRKFLSFAVVSCLMTAVQCALYSVLCQPDALGLMGVPAADFVYYGGSCIIMFVLLRKHLGSIGIGSIAWMALRALVAAVGGAAVAYGIKMLLPTGTGMAIGFLQIVVCGIAGLVVAFALCALFRIPEMRFATRILKKFLPASKASKKADSGKHVRR